MTAFWVAPRGRVWRVSTRHWAWHYGTRTISGFYTQPEALRSCRTFIATGRVIV